jgi:hypothetical protein
LAADRPAIAHSATGAALMRRAAKTMRLAVSRRRLTHRESAPKIII